MCNNSVIFFFCDSDAVSQWMGSCKSKLKNAAKRLFTVAKSSH